MARGMGKSFDLHYGYEVCASGALAPRPLSSCFQRGQRLGEAAGARLGTLGYREPDEVLALIGGCKRPLNQLGAWRKA